jgi:hypothetical protein
MLKNFLEEKKHTKWPILRQILKILVKFWRPMKIFFGYLRDFLRKNSKWQYLF